MAGETLRAAASGSFWERAREAKGRMERATADIAMDGRCEGRDWIKELGKEGGAEREKREIK